MIEQFLFELPIFLGIIVVTYLTSTHFNWFSRHEVSRDVKPENIEGEGRVRDFLKFAENQSVGDYRINFTIANDKIRVKNQQNYVMFNFEVEDGFLDASDSVSLGRASKMMGFIEWAGNPNFIVKVMRSAAGVLRWFLGLGYLLAAFALFAPIFTDDENILPAFSVIYMLMLLMVAGNILMTVKECIVYIRQNRYSMKMLELYGTETNIRENIRCYLNKSMWCYYGISIIRILVVLIVMFFLAMYL